MFLFIFDISSFLNNPTDTGYLMHVTWYFLPFMCFLILVTLLLNTSVYLFWDTSFLIIVTCYILLNICYLVLFSWQMYRTLGMCYSTTRLFFPYTSHLMPLMTFLQINFQRILAPQKPSPNFIIFENLSFLTLTLKMLIGPPSKHLLVKI